MDQIGKAGTELLLKNGVAAVEIGKKGLSEAGRAALTYAQPMTLKAMEKAFEGGSKCAKLVSFL